MKNDLIAEAREACEMQYFRGTYQAGLMGRLADALEAVARERDAALAARDGWAARMGEFTAALAAIERIRQAVSGHPECDRYEEGDVISCGWKSAYASVVAALDGAPEPEEKP